MFNRKMYILLWSVLLLFQVVTSDSAAAQFPRPSGYVNDFAGVMENGTIRKLETMLDEVRMKTGAEIAVVTVKDIGGQDVNSYAVELMKEWGIGSKERNEGILILASVKERKLRIEVGYGLEHIITDAAAGQISDNYIVPYLKNDDYNTGLTQGALAVASIIAKNRGVELDGSIPVSQVPRSRRTPTSGLGSLVNLFVILFILMLLFGRRGGRGLLAGMLLGSMLGGGRRGHYGGGFGGGFGGGGGFSGFGGGFSGGGGASRSF